MLVTRPSSRGAQALLRVMLAAAWLALAACQRATPLPGSGLQGQVLIGPMCPVVQAGTPCPDRPYEATIAVRDEAGQPVTEFKSDAQGNFQVSLAPGTYTLAPLSPDGFTHAPEQVITVTAGAYALVTITYDSGLR